MDSFGAEIRLLRVWSPKLVSAKLRGGGRHEGNLSRSGLRWWRLGWAGLGWAGGPGLHVTLINGRSGGELSPPATTATTATLTNAIYTHKEELVTRGREAAGASKRLGF